MNCAARRLTPIAIKNVHLQLGAKTSKKQLISPACQDAGLQSRLVILAVAQRD
jgi:hypothetical protein